MDTVITVIVTLVVVVLIVKFGWKPFWSWVFDWRRIGKG